MISYYFIIIIWRLDNKKYASKLSNRRSTFALINFIVAIMHLEGSNILSMTFDKQINHVSILIKKWQASKDRNLFTK